MSNKVEKLIKEYQAKKDAETQTIKTCTERITARGFGFSDYNEPRRKAQMKEQIYIQVIKDLEDLL